MSCPRHPVPVPAHDLRHGPRQWTSAFTTVVDSQPVVCVRPLDTDRPSWSIYTHPCLRPEDYLGTLHANTAPDTPWWVQRAQERHTSFSDAVRSLRRPDDWQRHCDRVIAWARAALADPHLLVIDVQTTGLDAPYALQIAATDRHGRQVLDHTLNPQSVITAAATALHGLTTHDVATAATFSSLLPRITDALHGRRCLAYNMPFDRHVIERELNRHYARPSAVQRWLQQCRWEDALAPYATWRGLWSAKQQAYRYQPLGSRYHALTNCRLLLARLKTIANSTRA
ncbi:3'-5' exonuclease [Streptomyces sp. NPDC006372]|uniref:3'-5' exonuclease n=1 Tax=Streptomyces sp. NPDC006372 TaxID=3155599 RepID=UPI0033BD2E18